MSADDAMMVDSRTSQGGSPDVVRDMRCAVPPSAYTWRWRHHTQYMALDRGVCQIMT